MSDRPTTGVCLTDDELLILDGRCSPKVQAKVDAAKARRATAERFSELSETQAAFVAKVVAEAEKKGKLTFRHVSLRSCDVCGRSAGYYKFKRGRRKGQNDRKRPLSFHGVELADRFVSLKGYATVGCCNKCWGDEAIKSAVAAALAVVPAEMPKSVTGVPPQWKKHDIRRCKKCDWKGHEGEMGRNPTLMGGGTYPSVCPACGAESLLFGPIVFEHTGEHVVVPASHSLRRQTTTSNRRGEASE